MRRKTAVTTGEIAAHCQVSAEAVIKWIKSGKLEAYTTPGGHRRVDLAHFREFLQAHHMPPFEKAPTQRKILIVDDDPGVVRTIAQLLGKAEKYALATAVNGFEAGLQVLKFCPDLLILDLMMPQLDGFQVCRMLKSDPQTAHIKVLVLTGYASDENLRKALAEGAEYCMAKPIQAKELEERVAALLTAEQAPISRTA